MENIFFPIRAEEKKRLKAFIAKCQKINEAINKSTDNKD
jgi:hypothetical protein